MRGTERLGESFVCVRETERLGERVSAKKEREMGRGKTRIGEDGGGERQIGRAHV